MCMCRCVCVCVCECVCACKCVRGQLLTACSPNFQSINTNWKHAIHKHTHMRTYVHTATTSYYLHKRSHGRVSVFTKSRKVLQVWDRQHNDLCMCVCMHVCVCISLCVRACMIVCAGVCTRTYVWWRIPWCPYQSSSFSLILWVVFTACVVFLFFFSFLLFCFVCACVCVSSVAKVWLDTHQQAGQTTTDTYDDMMTHASARLRWIYTCSHQPTPASPAQAAGRL